MEAVRAALRLDALRKHTAIFAGSGSGKTVLIRRIVEECALRGVSAIVLDPNNDLARLGDPWPLQAWILERGETAPAYSLDPLPGPRPALHARLRLTLDEATEDQVHWCFRAIAARNAVAPHDGPYVAEVDLDLGRCDPPIRKLVARAVPVQLLARPRPQLDRAGLAVVGAWVAKTRPSPYLRACAARASPCTAANSDPMAAPTTRGRTPSKSRSPPTR